MSALRGLPTPARWAVIGAVGLGLIGGVVGLVVGLAVYPPTAWFAVFEVAIPAGILGGFLGLAGGSVAYCVHRLGRAPASGHP